MISANLGPWLCRRWVKIYTSCLPRELAEQRRHEITSDLWEHRNDSTNAGRSALSHNLDVIDRVLSGIPADLSWRKGIQQSQLRLQTGDPMVKTRQIPRSTIALIVLAAFGIATPLPFVALLGTGIKTAEIAWMLGCLGLAAVLAAGLVLRLRGTSQLVSTALLVVGAFSPSVAWFWMPPVYLVTVAIIVMALATFRSQPIFGPEPA